MADALQNPHPAVVPTALVRGGQRHVLVLGSYPAVEARHGGQVRLSQIVAAYLARGLRVTLATFFPGHGIYQSAHLGPGDVALPLDDLRAWRGQVAPFVEDLVSGEVVARDPQRLAALELHCGQIDVVHLEQPWLLPVVQALRERQRVGPFRLVYGSQNIEWRLKQAIFDQYLTPGMAPILAAIESLERACAREADLVAAVTEGDADTLRAWTDRLVVLAANGIAPWQAHPERLAHWRDRLGPDPFALYVASAHPPNVDGFTRCFGDSLAPLAPDHRVVLVGGVAEHIVQSAWYRAWEPLNARRLLAIGPVGEADLSALRDLAHAFVIPVTSGGGSNLKTAEALYARRHVVATPNALRGFEGLADAPGLCIVPPGLGFAQAVDRALASPLPMHDADSQARLSSLTWDRTLGNLCDALERLPAP